jgi:hypothetical protein
VVHKYFSQVTAGCGNTWCSNQVHFNHIPTINWLFILSIPNAQTSINLAT